ncbi:hypothetical protein WICPIJ_007601 [Wickerhamomyces pijperi]|uniref:Uncharacterized protein n=1 Tax=Wickerhamomyces pijperi TaxID=599730 RepID=A0A9P8Q244_WICPI|nr:hypothetical protein WICPIJ_007601 [Wickerhamomyces pijperi]
MTPFKWPVISILTILLSSNLIKANISHELLFYNNVPHQDDTITDYGLVTLSSSNTTTKATSLKGVNVYGSFANGTYDNIKDLVVDLLGENITYIEEFDLTQPHDYNMEDIENSIDLSVNILGEQLVANLYLKLYSICRVLAKMSSIVDKLGPQDYEAIFNYIYGEDEMEFYNGDKYKNNYYKNVKVESIQDLDSQFDEDIENYFDVMSWSGLLLNEEPETTYSQVPFIDMNDNPVGTVNAEGLSILKIPLLIIKLILQFFWELMTILKIIELLIYKFEILILKLIKLILMIIKYIKHKVIFTLEVSVWTVLSGKLFKKILCVILLILKKIYIITWMVVDSLYRNYWKLVFFFKRVKRKSLAIAVYFTEGIFAKLGKNSPFDRYKTKNFYSSDEDPQEFRDYDYFKDFSHYTLESPGNYIKKEAPDFHGRQIFGEYEDEFQLILADEDAEKVNEERLKKIRNLKYGPSLDFDFQDEFGISNVKLNIGKKRKLVRSLTEEERELMAKDYIS